MKPCEHGLYGRCKKCNKKYGHYHSGSTRVCHCIWWEKKMKLSKKALDALEEFKQKTSEASGSS